MKSMIGGTQLETFATRWNPVIDLGLKVLGTAWIVMTVASCVMLNDLLRSMGQVAAPVTGGASWGSLMIIGGIMAASLTGMCALFTSVHPLMSGLHGEGGVAWRTRFVFMGTGLCGTTVIALTAFSKPSLPTAAAVLLLSCIVVGVIAAGLMRPSRSSAGRAIVILNLASWMIIAALVSAIFTIQLYAILRFRVEGASTLMLAGAVALLPHCYCLVGPRYRYLGFMAIIVAWLLLFVAPGHRVVFLLALHLLGQGGGVAAGPIVSPSSSKVCNLGTFDRPVLYFSAEGCTRNVALRHLKEASMIQDPAILGKLVGCWRTTVKRRQEGCVVSRGS